VRQGTVLLKNVNATLPIDSAKVSSVAVIGPNANYSYDIAHYYGGNPCFNNYTDIVDAIQQFVPNTQVAQGLPAVDSFDTSLFPDAMVLALQVDLIVLAIGNSLAVEHEGMDRVSIDLPGAQRWLVGNITAVLAAAGKSTPVIAVTYGGGMVDVSSLFDDSGVGALLHAGYPSVQVLGVGDVIFGRTPDGRPVAPAGRMGQTTYFANYSDSVSLFDFGMRPGPSPWPPGSNPGRTHRFYTGTPVLPFGFGLSYTTWTYTPFNPPAPVDLSSVAAILDASQAEALSAPTAVPALGLAPKALTDIVVDYFVNVTNTGAVDSDDVVLGFLVPPGAGTGGVPLQVMSSRTGVRTSTPPHSFAPGPSAGALWL
jgi:xylan 1,4-beta-xylosidase